MSGRGKKASEQEALTSWREKRGGRSQYTERKRASERHSQTREHRGRDSSGHGRSEWARGTHLLESAEGQVRTQKENERVRGTHRLESTEGRDLLEHGKKAGERWALTSWRAQEGQVRTREEGEQRAFGTHSLETAEEGQVRTRKERK